MRYAWLLCCAVGLAPSAAADPLTFAEAIARASADGPSIAARKAAVETARLSIRPAGELPDPQLALGLDNFPVTGADRFRLNRDEMTMLSVGVMQDVPSDALRRARSGLATADAGLAGAALEVSRLEARLAVATAWIDAYFASARERVLRQLAEDVATLSEASTASLSSGAAPADAALKTRMDLAQIADRLAEVKFMTASARAELERWVGPIGDDLPGPAAPVFAIDPEHLRGHLENHVQLAGSSAEIQRARSEYEIARAGKQPDWSWSLMYGRRDPDFGDMVSFGLKFSLPLFQSTRQSPTIDARRADIRRADAEREAMVREHRAMLEARLAEHASLGERLMRARDVVLPLARQREAVAAAAHEAGTLPLADLIAIRREAREAELERIDLEHRLNRLDAVLSLEYGEVAP
ncbi:MAG: TolC family protein [Hyphomonadaceae bacterium]|nr:TolC family protein [Hyphomonadaceae bacterium]